MSISFWQNKRVLVTSPTSFLGAWTVLSLRHLGAQVFGFGEASALSQNLFDLANLGQKISMTYGDVRDEKSFRDAMQFAQADVVIHLGETGFLHEAGRDSIELVSKAVMGTTLLMEFLRETASVRSVVVVSSDKVYERSLENRPLTEADKVGSQDLLTTSKLCSELIALSYRNSVFNPDKYNKHKIAIATARIGAGYGGGDFIEKSLIPQYIQSLVNKTEFQVRNPHSVRPWIHVLDQVRGILLLAEKLFEKGPKLAETYNLGASDHESVGEVLKELAYIWKGEHQEMEPHDGESFSLHGVLNSSLAAQDLGWQPKIDLSEMLGLTVGWFKGFYDGNLDLEHDRQITNYYGAQINI